MGNFKDILFGANIICLIYVLIQIIKNTYNDMTIFTLCLLIIYFILEIICRVNINNIVLNFMVMKVSFIEKHNGILLRNIVKNILKN